jgi:hypothetical protein
MPNQKPRALSSGPQSKAGSARLYQSNPLVSRKPLSKRPKSRLVAPSCRSTMSTYRSPMWGKADPKQIDIDCSNYGCRRRSRQGRRDRLWRLNPGISPDLYLLRLRSSRRDKCWDQDHIWADARRPARHGRRCSTPLRRPPLPSLLSGLALPTATGYGRRIRPGALSFRSFHRWLGRAPRAEPRRSESR